MKKKQYSYSRIDLYEKCPHAFKVAYLDKIPRVQNEALEVGTRLHGLVADYLIRLITLGQSTDWDWARGAAPRDGLADAAEIWEQFYSNFSLPPALDAPGVERKLAFDRNWEPCEFNSDDVYFRMIIDFHFRQNDLGVIVDWKTNRAIPATVEKNLQLRIYGWGLKKALYPEVKEVMLRLHYLRYGKEREVLLSSEDLDGVPDTLNARIEEIEADTSFTPTPGSFCGWCGVTSHCPVMASALVPADVMVAPATREQAEKAASLLLTLQRMEKDLAARLKEWVKEYGPLKVGDLVYGPTKTTSYDMNPQAVVEYLLEAGLKREDIWPLLGVTKTTLERGLKRLHRQDLLEQILSTSLCKTTERIDFKKI